MEETKEKDATSMTTDPRVVLLHPNVLELPGYDPDPMLDTLLKRFTLKNDAQLCRVLRVAPPVISKIRHRRLPVSAALLIRIHDAFGIPIDELRRMMGLGRDIPTFPVRQAQPEAVAA